MALKQYKPTTATRRHTKLLRFDIREYMPENVSDEKLNKVKSEYEKYQSYTGLSTTVKYSAGRDTTGTVSMRGKGGKAKRKYRIIDFNRDKREIPAVVVTVEYDPNRSANIALVKYADGELKYIIAPVGLKLGDTVIASEQLTEVSPGNAFPLKAIPAATFVHNIELTPGKGGILGRSAGAAIQVQGKSDKGYIQVKMPSGEIRLIHGDCYATIGTVGNVEHKNQKIGKAGRSRKRGIRPTVRGVAQSYKHPHGGGQGKSGRHGTGGPAKDPWGNKQGKITRRRKNTNKFIIKRKTSTLRPRNKPYKTIA
jgi:large subunit ribosomal protein L2